MNRSRQPEVSQTPVHPPPAVRRSLALIDDDTVFAPVLAEALGAHGLDVSLFSDGDEFLTHPAAFDFDHYLVDLMLPGIDGLNLVRLIRRKGSAGIIVVSGRDDDAVFEDVMKAGADMHLGKPVRVEEVVLAINAVARRIDQALAQVGIWRLDLPGGWLVAPDGARIPLSETDCQLLDCFLAAEGRTVPRSLLRERLGRPQDSGDDNAVHAAIYRLRRRIEQVTPVSMPLRAEAKVGYTFRGRLLRA